MHLLLQETNYPQNRQLIVFKVEVISGVEIRKIQVKSGEKVSTETYLNTE